ncbi:MAG: response regulator transcription factor [Actinomycetota bacterium]
MAKKVLVVDDDAVIRQLLVVNLEIEGYAVDTAADGEQALLKIAARPDCVLLDVMMPKFDGWEVARRAKADPKTAGVPIIFLSARAQDLDVRRGMDLGVAGYMTKPFDPLELMDVVRRVIAGERISPQQS